MGNHDLQTETINADFQLDVPRRLVQEVPEDLRTDDDQLAVYLIQALEIGLKAMAQAGMGGAVIMVANSAKRAAVGWMGDRG